MSFEIICGDALTVLRGMPECSVDCVVTSPPYWGLRNYQLPPSVWGGDSACAHEWQDASWKPDRWGTHDDDNPGDKQRTNNGSLGHRGAVKEQSLCVNCGAWLGSLGLEPTHQMFVEHLASVFREVRRVLSDNGTIWVNLGDSYGSGGGKQVLQSKNASHGLEGMRQVTPGVDAKQLIGIPWRVALALQSDGWFLRQEIIWQKVNCMPESVKDRPTRSHEQIFLLAKSSDYFYNWEAIQEPASDDTHARYARGRSDNHKWADGGPGNQSIAKSFEYMRVGREGKNSRMHQDRDPNHPSERKVRKQDQVGNRRYTGFNARWDEKERLKRDGVNPKCAEPGSGIKMNSSFSAAVKDVVEFRNKRSVWTIPTQPFPEAHFATFPEALVEPCVLAGCPPVGKRCDCGEIIETPTGEGESEDPTIFTGRHGMNRPRRENEGRRPITRLEQRDYARQMRESPHREEMNGRAGEAFAHYIRTDKSGARPLPPELLEEWLACGWLIEAPKACGCPVEPAGVVLDPFCGSGTVGLVAKRLGCSFVGIELNPEYVKIAERRCSQEVLDLQPLAEP